MGKEYPLAASCCLKSECIFKDLTTTPSYCLKRILFVLLHIQYVHTLQLSPQGPAGDQSRAPKRCRCREASPCHAEASSAQYHCSLTSASQIRLILAQQPHISQPQLQINSNSKLEYLKSSGKGLLLQHSHWKHRHRAQTTRQSIPIQLTSERGQSTKLPKPIVGFYRIDYSQYTINPQ